MFRVLRSSGVISPYRRVKKDSFAGGTRYKERLVILRSYDTMGAGAMDWMPDCRCARTGIGGIAMWLAEVNAKAKRRNQILFGVNNPLLVELRCLEHRRYQE